MLQVFICFSGPPPACAAAGTGPQQHAGVGGQVQQLLPHAEQAQQHTVQAQEAGQARAFKWGLVSGRPALVTRTYIIPFVRNNLCVLKRRNSRFGLIHQISLNLTTFVKNIISFNF